MLLGFLIIKQEGLGWDHMTSFSYEPWMEVTIKNCRGAEILLYLKLTDQLTRVSRMLDEDTRLHGQRWRAVYYNSSSGHNTIFAPFLWAQLPQGNARKAGWHLPTWMCRSRGVWLEIPWALCVGSKHASPLFQRETLLLCSKAFLLCIRSWKNSPEERAVRVLLRRCGETWETMENCFLVVPSDQR